MRMAQYVLGGGDSRKCQICYLIEGDVTRKTVHGGNVGRRSWDQSAADVHNAIAQLPRLGFSIMTSRSIMGSMRILSKIASDVSWKSKNNSIDCSLTYDDFLRRMKHCDPLKGDAPTSREHQNPAPPIVTPQLYLPEQTLEGTATALSPTPFVAEHDNNNGDGDDDDIPLPQEEEGGNNLTNHPNNNTEENIQHNPEFQQLKKRSMAELKQMCKERDEKQSGTKTELIRRLLQPRKPEILIVRARRGQYVPKVPSCNAALMVALLLNQEPGGSNIGKEGGLTKENLMLLAEETGVSKDPMDGNGGFYDGWSGMRVSGCCIVKFSNMIHSL